MDEALSGGRPPAGKGVDSLLLKLIDMACTFEFALHFLRFDTVKVSENQIIIIDI